MVGFSPSQEKLLADFFLDVAKGALLAGMGFSVAVPTVLYERLLFVLSGLFVALFSLSWALWFSREVEIK